MTKKELTSIAGTPYRLDYCEAESILRHLVQKGAAIKKAAIAGFTDGTGTGFSSPPARG